MSGKKSWKVLKNKKLRIEGESYLEFRRTREGKVFHDIEPEARTIGVSCNSSLCRKSKQITDEISLNLFNSFWKTMN